MHAFDAAHLLDDFNADALSLFRLLLLGRLGETVHHPIGDVDAGHLVADELGCTR